MKSENQAGQKRDAAGVTFTGSKKKGRKEKIYKIPSSQQLKRQAEEADKQKKKQQRIERKKRKQKKASDERRKEAQAVYAESEYSRLIQAFLHNVENLNWTRSNAGNNFVFSTMFREKEARLNVARDKDRHETYYEFIYDGKRLPLSDQSKHNAKIAVYRTQRDIKIINGEMVLLDEIKDKSPELIKEPANRSLQQNTNKSVVERRSQTTSEATRIRKEMEERQHEVQRWQQEQRIMSPDWKPAYRSSVKMKDVVVRRSSFQCRSKNHQVMDIEAVVPVINRSNILENVVVPAGHCRSCNVYFIMESTWQSLKRKGMVLCRVIDEKSYIKSFQADEMNLAQESPLMQYGYSVSQENGLTSAERQRILSLIIDQRGMTKSEIISYLNFFINQRKGQLIYETAISKWKNDIRFVEHYDEGSYTRINVRTIYTKSTQ